MSRARRFVTAAAIAACALCGARLHAAPPADGELRVSLGAALPSASPVSPATALAVVITARHDTSDQRTASLDPGADAVFRGLPPATYDVHLTAGGALRAASAVTVAPGELVSLEAVPASAGDFRIAIVDRHPIALASSFDARLVADLPASRDVWHLVETSAPFVIVDRMDGGGAASASSPVMGSRAASWTATTVALDEIVVVDPGRTGRLDLAPDAAFIEGATVSAGLAPVEVGTPGVRLSLTPRRPGPARAIEAFGSFTAPAMVGANALPGAPSGTRIDSWREGGVAAGSPVTGSTGIFAAASASGARYIERGEAPMLAADRASAFGHAVSRRSARDQLRIVAGLQRVAHPFDERRQFADRASATESATLIQAQAVWERARGDGATWSLSGGLVLADRTPSVANPAGGVVDRVTDGLVPMPPAATDRHDWNLQARWAGRARLWGGLSHAPRAGASVRRTGLTSSLMPASPVAETVAGLPARVWVPHTPVHPSRRSATRFSAWLGDRLAWSSRLTLDVGVRLDHAGAAATGASNGLSWTTLSPRASFRWAPEPFAIFGGAGQYASSHVLRLVAHGDPGEAWFDVHRWRDANADGRVDPGESGELVARAGLGAAVAAIAPDVRAPLTREAILGAEYRIGHSTLRGAILIRRESRLAASVNVGVPASAWDVRLVPDANADWEGATDDRLLPVYDRRPESFGQDAFLLTTVDDDRVTYGGIEIGWHFLSDRWSMLFGARAYRTRAFGASRGFGPLENDQHVLGELYHQPNATPELPGSVYFDRSYVGKWVGSFHASDTWRFAFAARYQDGQAFSRVVVVPDLSAGPDFVQAYRVGQTRYTYTFTLDLRAEKSFDVGGRRLAVRLDVFNATNHRNELDEDVTTSPAFRTPLSVQPPLTARIGVRVVF